MVESGEIFIRNNLTDYEKLLFAQNEIKELKQQLKESNYKLGEVQAELDYQMSLNPEEETIAKYKKEVQNLNKGFKNLDNPNNKSWKSKYNNLFLDYIKLKNNL